MYSFEDKIERLKCHRNRRYRNRYGVISSILSFCFEEDKTKKKKEEIGESLLTL